MTMEDFIVKAVDLGIDGVDITTYWLKSTDPSYIASLRHFAFKQGVPFSGIAIRSRMCQPEPSKRAAAVAEVQKWVDVAEGLGAPHIRVFGGPLPAGASEEQGIAWVVETLKPACAYAAAKGISLGIEDHGGTTDIACKAATILEILRRVDSPYLGINLDIANFTEDQYRQIEACVPYATHSHIRDVFEDNKGPIDLDRVWRIFAQGGYKGYMSAEYEGEEDALTGVPKLAEKIKALCKEYSTV
jgi:sugar phosphate isomerase/epimerase